MHTRRPEGSRSEEGYRKERGVEWEEGKRGRKAVEQVGGGVETFSPEAGRQRGLDQKGAHDVIRRANHPLSLAVLGRGIRTRHTLLNTPREEERTGGGVVELPPVVTLDGLNGEALPEWTLRQRSGGGWGRSQTWRAKETSKSNERNHQPPPDSIYNQKC